MLGKFSREEEPDSSLDFTGGDGGPLVVVGQAGSLSSDSLKEIIDKGVHDAHGLGGDTSVGVDLLQHLVDVDSIGLLPLVLLLLVSLGDVLLGLAGLLGSLSGNLGGHDESCCMFGLENLNDLTLLEISFYIRQEDSTFLSLGFSFHQ